MENEILTKYRITFFQIDLIDHAGNIHYLRSW